MIQTRTKITTTRIFAISNKTNPNKPLLQLAQC